MERTSEKEFVWLFVVYFCSHQIVERRKTIILERE